MGSDTVLVLVPPGTATVLIVFASCTSNSPVKYVVRFLRLPTVVL
jgi:hypothetical protein